MAAIWWMLKLLSRSRAGGIIGDGKNQPNSVGVYRAPL